MDSNKILPRHSHVNVVVALMWRHQMEAFSPWPVNTPHKDQWRVALMFSLICALTNAWANHRDAIDLRRDRAHYDVTVMDYDTHA